MMPKYIEGDIVKYDDKIMVIKEPRDGSHFDLSCPQEGLAYCLVDVKEIKPIPITVEILKKNEWRKTKESFKTQSYYKKNFGVNVMTIITINGYCSVVYNITHISKSNYILFSEC